MLHRVLTVGDAQFLIQVANMGLDGGGRHVKLAGNLLVAVAGLD